MHCLTNRQSSRIHQTATNACNATGSADICLLQRLLRMRMAILQVNRSTATHLSNLTCQDGGCMFAVSTTGLLWASYVEPWNLQNLVIKSKQYSHRFKGRSCNGYSVCIAISRFGGSDKIQHVHANSKWNRLCRTAGLASRTMQNTVQF